MSEPIQIGSSEDFHKLTGLIKLAYSHDYDHYIVTYWVVKEKDLRTVFFSRQAWSEYTERHLKDFPLK